MPLRDLQAALAEAGQWLALDWPWGSDADGQGSGSIGGLVARGMAAGLRQRYLGVRDQVIGLALLRADGTAARAGGKVVKNVAGYDLVRLFAGSWGSLGLITELSLRTYPQPQRRRGLWLQGGLAELERLRQRLLAAPLAPELIDWWSAPWPRPLAKPGAGPAGEPGECQRRSHRGPAHRDHQRGGDRRAPTPTARLRTARSRPRRSPGSGLGLGRVELGPGEPRPDRRRPGPGSGPHSCQRPGPAVAAAAGGAAQPRGGPVGRSSLSWGGRLA